MEKVEIYGRQKVLITEVTDIYCFDDEMAIIETNNGIVTIKGSYLKLNKLDLSSGEICIEGTIDSTIYSNVQKAKSDNIISKIFKKKK